jgi:DNA-binding NarL/FixJ family response regulator
MPDRQIRILLVDDHQIVRQGLRTLMDRHADFAVVGEASDGRTAVQLCDQLSPDVVIMDVAMPELNGIEATRRISGTGSMGNGARLPAKVIALSMHADSRFATEMMRAGAKAYLLKDAAFEELAVAVRTVVEGREYLSPRIAGAVVGDMIDKDDGASPFQKLSPREREVLQLLAEGRATKEIARQLDVSAKTIETHRRKLMEKLNIYSVAELTKYAVREGLTALGV